MFVVKVVWYVGCMRRCCVVRVGGVGGMDGKLPMNELGCKVGLEVCVEGDT